MLLPQQLLQWLPSVLRPLRGKEQSGVVTSAAVAVAPLCVETSPRYGTCSREQSGVVASAAVAVARLCVETSQR